MHFLIFAIIASTSILICFKIFDRFNISTLITISINYLTGSIIGFISLNSSYSVSSITNSEWFPVSFLLGFILITGFILFAISTNRTGIAITSISSRISIIFSVLLGIFLFNDTIDLVKSLGLSLALISLVLIFYRKGSLIKNSSAIIVPFLVFLLSGLNDSTLKIAQHYYIQANETDYIAFAATSFLIAFIVSTPMVVTNKLKGKIAINIKSIIAGVILGILNWLSIYLMLNGLEIMSVSIFFPILNIGVVTLSTIIGFIIFKENFKTINFIGIVIAILSITLITVKF